MSDKTRFQITYEDCESAHEYAKMCRDDLAALVKALNEEIMPELKDTWKDAYGNKMWRALLSVSDHLDWLRSSVSVTDMKMRIAVNEFCVAEGKEKVFSEEPLG